MELQDGLTRLVEDHPGYARFIAHISTLACSYTPFVYINDITNTRATASVLDALFRYLSTTPSSSDAAEYSQILYAHVNAVACFTTRIFYDSVLNALAKWQVNWSTGCLNWPGDGDGKRWNDSFDSFLHGLRALRLQFSATFKGRDRRKAQEPVMVLVVERAERLAQTLPDLIVPLSRLAELSRIKIMTVFLSSVRWDDIKPPIGASPEPYYMEIDPPAKHDIIKQLVLVFKSLSLENPVFEGIANIYHPALLPLYEHFVSIVHSVCAIYTTDPAQLQYIAAARWPGFVLPVLQGCENEVQQNDAEESPAEGLSIHLTPPSEDVRIRLTRRFTPSITAAMEALYPRLTNATDWAIKNTFITDSTSETLSRLDQISAKRHKKEVDTSLESLPRMSKFILLAAFLSSNNPPKTDMKMFGKGAEERKKRRRKRASPKKNGSQGAVSKVPQRLLGPNPFALDRLLAILAVLLEENDFDTRHVGAEYTFVGEYTEMEVGRIQIYAAITELTSMRLLHRTTPGDRIDGPPMFKCGTSCDQALILARELQVPLNDLMWDPA